MLTYAETILLNDTLKIIGRNINNIRVKRNFTLRKMSRLTGLNIETIDRYELGRTKIHLQELLKISIALEMPLEKLIGNRI